MVPPETRRLLRAASVAEVAWYDDGPHATGVLPLVGDAGPVLALPYAERALARALGSVPEVVLTVTEPRGTQAGYRPTRLRCRPQLVADPDGERFAAELLDQELLRWQPSRTLADSPLLRRENWWWLPRLLVELAVLEEAPFESRADPADHLLVVAPDTPTGGEAGAPEVALARVGTEALHDPGTPPLVRVRQGAPDAGRAVLFGQDLAFPDLERWGRWSWNGRWDGSDLTVERSPDRTGLPPVPGVLARWRRQRSLERACRRALAREASDRGAKSAW